jgi:hypothetical protein
MDIRLWPNKFGQSIVCKDIKEAMQLKQALDWAILEKLIDPQSTTIVPLSNEPTNSITVEIF